MKTKYINSTKEKITDEGVKNSSVKKILKGDILLSFKLSIGKVAIANNEMYCNEAIAFFRGNKNVKTNYLYQYFLTNDITSNKTGCIGNGSLNKDSLKNLNITIPSIEDQEAIIKEMEYFDNLKEMYQTHITNTEKQIKERFEYHLNKCKNIVSKDTNESKENIVDSETEDDEEEKSIKKTKSTKSKVEKELETDTEDEKPIKKSSKKINKSTKKY